MFQRLYAVLICLSLPGCVVVQVGATNPIPGLSTVAVAPFMNLSQEPAVDGRRFAMAYYTELQKTPGFQVIPVGVVEQVMTDYQLELNNPDDVVELARILEVDAVVVGAVTDYDAYYPPRLGLQVSWYSPEPWQFSPGVPVDPYARSEKRQDIDEMERQQERYRRIQRVQRKEIENAIRRSARDEKRAQRGEDPSWSRTKLQRVIRSQTPDVPPRVRANGEVDLTSRDLDAPGSYLGEMATENRFVNTANTTHVTVTDVSQVPEHSAKSIQTGSRPGQPVQSVKFVDENQRKSNQPTSMQTLRPVSARTSFSKPIATDIPPPVPNPYTDSASGNELQPDVAKPTYMPPPMLKAPGLFSTPLIKVDSSKPIMSYTRIFDGADADLQAALRDYIEISGDMRGGGWKAYLYRSEDFIRFTAHMMVVEMLTLHGGQGKRRVIFKLRKQK